MSQIIASTYEIIREIGSGGGGVVYLGRHTRLGKWIVLKADKRNLSTKPDVLRREVDALKNLNHTYIPQVYDFVVENGIVYTIMDYVEGESLDKALERGEKFHQVQVIRWARQLLQALCYLHSRSPHGILHADIKPANIMRTPQNDICLIDFNIALALGEDGAVRAGFSRGYASPEHYGIDYKDINVTQGVNEDVVTRLTTDQPDTILSDTGGMHQKKSVLLDVRSDIYSLGATLYHLLTGRRPNQSASEVEPITEVGISPAVAEIIKKAMMPNPDLRYQTAAEMLYDFEHLHEQDPRTKKHRRNIRMTAAVCTALFLAGGFTAFTGLKQMEGLQAAYAQAEYSATALRNGDVAQAVSYAMQGLRVERGLFDPPNTPQAQKALTDALGVYNLSDGYRANSVLELPSAPLKVVLSPGGERLAAIYAFHLELFETATGNSLVKLPVEESALSDVLFLDENKIVYAAPSGVTAYDLNQGKVLWTGKAATSITCSADGQRIAAVYKDSQEAFVYRASDGMLLKTVSFEGNKQYVTENDRFADPEDNLFVLNGDGTRLAVSFADGSLIIFDLEQQDNDLLLLDPSGYFHFEGGFFGQYFAFSVYGEGESIFSVIDVVNMVETGGFYGTEPYLLQVDESGIYIAAENVLVKIDPESGEQTEVAYTGTVAISGFQHGENHTIASAEDQTYFLFDQNAFEILRMEHGSNCDFVGLAGEYAVIGSRDSPELRLMKQENHREEVIFTYDPEYLHNEARISADGQTIMLFRYDSFRLYNRDGTLITEVDIPDAEQVYDQQYRRDSGQSWLDVIYNDGTIRAYSAVDGSLISERKEEKPDLSLYEEFFTDHLRITAPLHETPVAYDRESGKEIRILEKDSYLTYVTQVGQYVITEYISAQGERYGLLLDENCETLAYLPELCDVSEGQLVFDDMLGNLRETRIYSLQELMALATLY